MTCVSGCASTAPASDSGFENLPKARLPIFSVLRILSAEQAGGSGEAAIDASGFQRDQTS